MASILGGLADETLDLGPGLEPEVPSVPASSTTATTTTTELPVAALDYGWVVPVIVGAICVLIIALCVAW